MSWLLNLYKTYEANVDRVGEIEIKGNDREFTLLPVSHTTQTAHIEVLITENGDFHSASVIKDKKDSSTLIPCTEESASRAGSKVAPYPLHDKLSYVAGDFVEYGGKIKKEVPFEAFISKLEQWASSKYAIPKVVSIYRYLSKRRLIQDLVADKKIFLDEQNHLIDKWNDRYKALHGDKPDIFSVAAGGQESAFVRFDVHTAAVTKPVWKDPEMYDSFVRYYSHLLGEEDFCYVSGELLPATDRHANKIRNAGDKAKLISANDTSGFTFRGRFSASNQAASISYEVSQKAHNALKWLINRQATIIDQRVFLVWGNDAVEAPPNPNDDLIGMGAGEAVVVERKSYTYDDYARQVGKALGGYKNKLSERREFQVNILVLDSATTGRMAVLYYRNIQKELYLDRLIDWHTTCAWLHHYRKNNQGEFVTFYGAPATKDIAFAAYGPNAGDKVVKGLMERMLPCIVDGRSIPKDIVLSAARRASNPVAMERWEWEKTLSIACALINKDEEWNKVSLDPEIQDRDYLFGRLLAIADVLERTALDMQDEKRSTNAVRYMNVFAMHPERTWKTIQAAILPYQVKIGNSHGRINYLTRQIDEVISKFSFKDFNNEPLSGKYLLGFNSQRYALYQPKEGKKDNAGLDSGTSANLETDNNSN